MSGADDAIPVITPLDVDAAAGGTPTLDANCSNYSTNSTENKDTGHEGSSGGGARPVTRGVGIPPKEHHVKMLLSSAIGVEQVEQRGYRTVTARADLERLGFTPIQRRVPALLLPLHGVHSEIAGYQTRPDIPRIDKRGKVVKYETPGKSHMVLDVPPGARGRLRDPAFPLFITEGVKKADAAVTKGLCCIALLGVWNFRGRNDVGGTVALPEWDSIALNGRDVYVVFDSDVVVKSQVHAAMARIKAYLENREAKVRPVYLPCADGGVKIGMDDFFAAGHSVGDLLARAEDDLRAAPPELEDEGRYRITDDGIFVLQSDRTGWLKLTNFGARIVADKTLDDGVEPRRTFTVETRLGDRAARFDVPAGDFEDLRWVAEQIGAGATVFPVRGAEKHVRAAIQSISGMTAPRVQVMTHTGWTRQGDAEVFVHGAGAIGELGSVAGIEVALDETLDAVVLPAPPGPADLRRAVASVFALLDVATPEISATVIAAPLRIVLEGCDFAIHFAGATGVFKTALAALAQQFFGAGFGAHRLPANWTWTANSIEALAFAAKDIVIVVDDFAPSGGVDGLRKLQEISDRLFRNQGNRGGRGRCASDGSLRRTKWPRGLILSSGEDIPRGASIRARVFIVHVAAGEVDVKRLTQAQSAAQRGDFALAMSAYLRYVAPKRSILRQRLVDRVRDLRTEMARDGLHRRTPGICADLLFGIEAFVEFAVESGAVDAVTGRDFLKRARDGLETAVHAQRGDQLDAEPATRFLDLVRSALVSGEAHVGARDGRPPADPSAWGWECSTVPRNFGPQDEWRPRGHQIGWVDGDDLYLDPDASIRSAQAMGTPTGEPLAVLPTTIAKRLKDRGLLRSVSPDGKHLTIQVMIGGSRRRVLHLDAGVLLGTSDPSPVSGAEPPLGQIAPVVPAPPDPSPSAPPWSCFNCGGTSPWHTRLGGDIRCRTCAPPGEGAEAL